MFSGHDVKFNRVFFNSHVSDTLMQKDGTFGLGDIFILICWWFDFDVSFCQCRKYRVWILLILQWFSKWGEDSLRDQIIKQPKHFKSY